MQCNACAFRCRLSMVFLTTFAALLGLAPAACLGSDEVAALVEAWRRREADVSSAEFRWRYDEAHPQTSSPGLLDKMQRDERDVVRDVGGKVLFIFEGRCFRYEHVRRPKDPATGGWGDAVHVYDGTVAKRLSRSKAGEGAPSLVVAPNGKLDMQMVLDLRPIVWWLRPFDADFAALDPGQFTFVGPVSHDGHACLRFEYRGAPYDGDRKLLIDVDPNAGYAMRRYAFFGAGNRLAAELLVDYAGESVGGPTPKAWRLTTLNAEREIKTSVQYEVVDWKLNVAVEPDTFVLPDAPEAYVYDESTGRTTPPKTDLPHFFESTEAAVLVAAGTSLFLIALLFWRRRRSRQK